ncbi:hypothetical protein [Cribrihabitans neustonicus]|uniref:hypothetical protein n=1 Tax=Cribrihabitans neustonicus TaxID=1429085 RepID=UPI003B5CBFF4
MTLQPKFTQAPPVKLDQAPVVLRFQGLFPRELGKFSMHDKRRGGDLDHVARGLSGLNQVLSGEPGWQQRIHEEVAGMREHNFEEQLRALRARSRIRDAVKVEALGPVDPWRTCRAGPLREGLLSVNKAWCGGAGVLEWDPERAALFRDTAIEFLTRHFPGGQLRYAVSHADEEACHIHFIVAVWAEKRSANRGRQILLQPSMNPLLKNYEHAQDLAGQAFGKIGIIRGERRAAARRGARAEGRPLPEKRRHVPPSQWRVEECRRARAEAEQTAADGRALAQAAIKKARERANRETRARMRQAALETEQANRRRDAAEAEARRYEARVEEAAENHRFKVAARKAEEEKLERMSGERNRLEQALAAKKEEIASLAGKQRQLIQRCRAEQLSVSEARAARLAGEKRLKEAEEKVRLAAAEAEVITAAIGCGLDLVADGALFWREAAPGQQPYLAWGASAPRTKGGRNETLKTIRPSLPMVKRLAQLVRRTVRRILVKERVRLRADAEYVRGLRAQWEPEASTRLERIILDEPGNGPG